MKTLEGIDRPDHKSWLIGKGDGERGLAFFSSIYRDVNREYKIARIE